MNKRVVWIITVSIALIGCVAAGVQLLFPSRFDAVRWQTADSAESFLRRREMIRDVNKLFDDQTIDSKQSAVRQLGHPQRRHAESDDLWYYDLGAESAGANAVPHSWLELRFDANEKLVFHRVVQE